MKLFIIPAFLFSLISTAAFSDPVNEYANYKVDNARNRTSSMIKRGTVRTEVLGFNPEGENGPVYNTNIEYDVTIQLAGRQQGEEVAEIPEEFFSPDFIEKLRQEGEIHYPQFKIRHLGYADATNMDGTSYPNCDKVFIYDIDMQQASALKFFQQITGKALATPADEVEDVEVTALITESLPVLGAAKIDISGVARGYDFKVGFDYLTP
ncbi:MAG: hypothetical protein R3B45_02205 [Bdellovibrionota bacterium]